jgi:RNA polymerase sigma-70 factor (ECF subfamily)
MAALDRAARECGGRIVAALAARYRDLDLAEEGFAEACARAAAAWPERGTPANPAGWLYRTASRHALDLLRRRAVRDRLAPPIAEQVEDEMEDRLFIPDERLRLIFVCCHPAIAPDARAALTLRLVCGLSTREIARAFLVAEPSLAQRLVRAKRKIAGAGIPFEVPSPGQWPERLESVLSTLEIAYSKAHEDAAGSGEHAGYAEEVLHLTAILVELLPREPELLALAATVRYAEARRPARVKGGAMVPLSDQDPRLWRTPLIREADILLAKAGALPPPGPRLLQASIHAAWCARRDLAQPPPWARILDLYDALLLHRDDPIVRLNRAVALAEVAGADAALAELDRLEAAGLESFLPWHAVRADLLRRTGRGAEALAAYDAALALGPADAERIWLELRRAGVKA